MDEAKKRQYDLLPEWFRDEVMLRRILMCRAAGLSMADVGKRCGISKGQWARVRGCALHSRIEGNRVAAKAFLDRFDSFMRLPSSAAPFSPSDGKTLAASIARWKIPVGELPDAD